MQIDPHTAGDPVNVLILPIQDHPNQIIRVFLLQIFAPQIVSGLQNLSSLLQMIARQHACLTHRIKAKEFFMFGTGPYFPNLIAVSVVRDPRRRSSEIIGAVPELIHQFLRQRHGPGSEAQFPSISVQNKKRTSEMVTQNAKDTGGVALALRHRGYLFQKKRDKSFRLLSLFKQLLQNFCDHFIISKIVCIGRHNDQWEIQFVCHGDQSGINRFHIVAHIIENDCGFSDFIQPPDRVALRIHIIHHGCKSGDDQLIAKKKCVCHSKNAGIFEDRHR